MTSPHQSGAHGRGSSIRLTFGQATDPGLDPNKQNNEDACGYAETAFGHLFVVCDGMGGHAGGKEAAEIAVRTVFDQFASAPPIEEPREILRGAVQVAAREVYNFGGAPEVRARPGSTCVALLLHDGCIETAHVGDSRVYAIRGNQIYKLTRDHSMVQTMIDAGQLTEQEAIGHPDSNKITRALGMTPTVEVELSAEPMELYAGDVFVLATDGLTDLAQPMDILMTVNEYMKRGDLNGACQELIQLANRRGGHDNITVQVLRVDEAGEKRRLTQVQEPLAPLRSAPKRKPSTTLQGMPLNKQPHMLDTGGPPPGPVAGQGVSPTLPETPLLERTLDEGLEEEEGSGMTVLILVMAGIIGLLLTGLLLALYYR